MKLESIINLDKYPIHEYGSLAIKRLIKTCNEELEKFSCCTIPNFILPKSIKIMKNEVEKKLDEVYWSEERINPYLNSKDEVSLPKDNPKRIFSNRNNGYLNSDLFDKSSELKFLYERQELLNFVSA